MRMKVSDYIADFLVAHGISQVFTITGGGAMHLNDALGHKRGLSCLYQHHEQACAMAAECYARINGRPAALCITSGPGGTNTLTGVVGGWLDSVPMLVLSGQVRYDTTARSTGLNLRAMGDQEFDIVKAVDCMTKYCEMVAEPNTIRYCLEKALHIATTGRPGPCWLDIPLNVQGATIETDDLNVFDSSEYDKTLAPAVTNETIGDILQRITLSKRPVFNAGNGIRLSGGFYAFQRVAEKLGIPVVTGFNSIDLIDSAHPLYCGRAGSLGDRAGNFAVQNSDMVLSVGSRLSLRQVSYNYKAWAREAYTIVVDADSEELKKPTVHIDFPLWADAKEFLEAMDRNLSSEPLFKGRDWLNRCLAWREKYPVVLAPYEKDHNRTNLYAFIKVLGNQLSPDSVVVTTNGSVCVTSSQALKIRAGQRYIMNSAIASMGYGLPASIGACIAAGKRDVVCLEGDGSLQMNLQELQTIIHHNLPVKIFVANNQGYHSIRMTQHNFFGEPLVGVGTDSKDLSFPNLEKIAAAYGLPYFACAHTADLNTVVSAVLSTAGPVMCEMFTSTTYEFMPKSTAKQLPDGTMVSAPLEDLYPLLPADELKENMLIPLVEQ